MVAVALQALQKLILLAGLNSFCDSFRAQVLAHGNDRLADDFVITVAADIGDERAVDLELINGKSLQVRERGINHAKIVECETDAELRYSTCRLRCPAGRSVPIDASASTWRFAATRTMRLRDSRPRTSGRRERDRFAPPSAFRVRDLGGEFTTRMRLQKITEAGVLADRDAGLRGHDRLVVQ